MPEKIVVVNYADENYRKTQEYNTKTALKIGKADEVYSYQPKDIDENFLKKHEEIFSIKRGAGLWLWKPYFVKKTLEKLNMGDILFYCDSGAYFTNSIKKLVDHVGDFNILVFDIPLIEEQFTKARVFEELKINTPVYRKSNQIIATYFVIRKTEFTIKFIDEWLALCTQYNLISPSDGVGEAKNFISHREDQSLFSVLCKKYGLKAYQDISQRRNFPKSYYYEGFEYKSLAHDKQNLPIILYLHKMKVPNKWNFMKQRIKMIIKEISLIKIN